jgi:excisionase family DNA binding protein
MSGPILPDVARLITILEAGHRLGVHPKTIRRAIGRRELTSHKLPLDRRVYVDADEVEQLRELRAQRELEEER